MLLIKLPHGLDFEKDKNIDVGAEILAEIGRTKCCQWNSSSVTTNNSDKNKEFNGFYYSKGRKETI